MKHCKQHWYFHKDCSRCQKMNQVRSAFVEETTPDTSLSPFSAVSLLSNADDAVAPAPVPDGFSGFGGGDSGGGGASDSYDSGSSSGGFNS
jgi:hypothetical protein